MISPQTRNSAMAINGNKASQDRILWIAGLIEAIAAAFIILGLISSSVPSNSLLEGERVGSAARMIK